MFLFGINCLRNCNEGRSNTKYLENSRLSFDIYSSLSVHHTMYVLRFCRSSPQDLLVLQCARHFCKLRIKCTQQPILGKYTHSLFSQDPSDSLAEAKLYCSNENVHSNTKSAILWLAQVLALGLAKGA